VVHYFEVSKNQTIHKTHSTFTKYIHEVQIADKISERHKEEAKFNLQTAQLRLKEEVSRYQSLMNQVRSDIEQAKLRLQEEENSYKSSMRLA
jgi:HlyD family secretion protein